MALKLKLTADEWKGLNKKIKGLYAEKDGSYVLAVDGLEDTTGLKTALEKERKARSEYEKAVKKFEGLGKSPDEISALMAEIEQIRASGMSEAEKLKAENEALKKSKEAAEAEISTLKTGQLKARLLGEAGLPLVLADRLKGGTEEEIKADLEEVKKLFKVQSTLGTPSNPGAPKDETPEARGKRLAEERKKKPVAEGLNQWKAE